MSGGGESCPSSGSIEFDTLILASHVVVPSPSNALGEPIQLLKLESRPKDEGSLASRRVVLNPKAVELLRTSISMEEAIVISVCGEYRTGKSYLLNLLIGLVGPENPGATLDKEMEAGQKINQGFQVGNTVKACTEGIWMWIAKKNSRFFVILDCEGSGSTSRSREHDSSLYALALLLSDLFVYNSKGVLDEHSVQALATATELASLIHTKTKDGGSEMSFPTSAPSLLWVLRDFVLALQDKNGNPISSDEYLESTLRDSTSAAVRKEEGRKARERLTSLFADRHCSCLVCPVIDEEKLQKLESLPWTALRQPFRHQISSLREQVFKSAVNGASSRHIPFTGRLLATFIERLADAISQRGIPDMGSTWEEVQHEECAKVLDEMHEQWIRFVFSVGLPQKGENMREALEDWMDKQLSKFDSLVLGCDEVAPEYRDKLEQDMTQTLESRMLDNKTKGEDFCCTLLDHLWAERIQVRSWKKEI